MIIKKISLILISFNIYSQSDSIKLNINLTNYSEKANLNFNERYYYTYNNFDSIKQIFNPKEFKYLISYDIDSFHIKSIPQFEIKTNAKICRRENFINYINFENDFESQYFNIYLKDRLIMNTRYLLKEKSDIVDFSLIEYDFNNPIMYGGIHGFLMKLMLERKFFVFMIKGFGDTYFIYEKNKIFAIYNPDSNGNYEKKEINEYVGKVIGKRELKKILNGYSISTTQINNSIKNMYYNKNYNVFLKIN